MDSKSQKIAETSEADIIAKTQQNRKYKESLVGKIIKIVSIVVLVLFLPLLIVNCTLIAKSYINKNEVPDFFGFKPFIVVTQSMEPIIDAGDLILVKEKGKDYDYKVGDIISFNESDADGSLIIVTHEIVAISGVGDNREIITKGVNNNTTDAGVITPEQIEGVYLFRVKGMGNFAMFMQSPIGIIVILGVFVAIFIAYDMFSRKRKLRQSLNDTNTLQKEIERLKELSENSESAKPESGKAEVENPDSKSSESENSEKRNPEK